MTGAEKTAAEFVTVVKQALASVPPPRLGPGTDLDAAAAELAERLIAAYPYPRQRGLVGMRAIIDAHGADSSMGVRARFQLRLYDFGIRYRGQRHREAAGLPAPLVEEPDMDAAAAELADLYRLRQRGVEARSDYAPA